LPKASLAFFTSTFAEPDLEQPVDHPATIPATIPATNTIGPDDLGLGFMKSNLSSFHGYIRPFSRGVHRITGSRFIDEGTAPTGDDLGSRTADRARRSAVVRSIAHFSRPAQGVVVTARHSTRVYPASRTVIVTTYFAGRHRKAKHVVVCTEPTGARPQ
jgi:hypothetical protein